MENEILERVLYFTPTQWQIILAAVQAVSAITIAAVTIMYTRWTKVMAQTSTLPDVRPLNYDYNLHHWEEDDTIAEGWFITLKNYGSTRSIVHLERRKRNVRGIERLRYKLEKTKPLILNPNEERTVLLHYSADPKNEKLLVRSKTISGVSIITTWEFINDGQFFPVI